MAVCVMLCVLGTVVALHYVEGHKIVQHRVDFSRDIRPIFNQSCVSCHGGVRQKNGVSFIYREEALGKGQSGHPTIVPGHPERSELIARLTSADPEARMPYHAPPLPLQQIALLRQWIKEGAQWEDHWAFVAPKPQALPAVKNTAWPKQPFDRFILARLEKEGLSPSQEANRAALLRRVSFDLTGLPPAPEELSTFLTDSSPAAYEKQVDRLLVSPHYGERWAALWLDLARYADSRGYSEEGGVSRPSWPYRDWVIDAFNRNIPYDRFVMTQLAGDLLPNATFEDQIATSFQRQTPTNDEAGTDDEEFRLVAVMDRVATTWSVLNGLTMNCVQCHSHPYDPIRHAEYYKFLAFYNTSRDADLADDSPNLPVAEPSRRGEVAQLEERRLQLRREIVEQGRTLAGQALWTPLPIATATANEVEGLKWALAEFKRLRLPSGISKEQRKGFDAFPYRPVLDKAAADLARAERSPHVVPLKIDHGEAQADKSTPSQSLFELKTAATPPVMTALRIEVPPKDSAAARHTPEDGFIVNRVDAWIVAPQGHEQKIEFRYCVPDSEENLTTARRSEEAASGGFAAYSKLSQSRWMIAIPENPLILAPGSRLKVQLMHAPVLPTTLRHARFDTSGDQQWMRLAADQALAVISAEFLSPATGKPTIVRRVRLTASSDERWTALASDGALVAKLTELSALERRLTRIPTVPVPVMAEERASQQRQTLEFERGNFLNPIGPPLSPDVPSLFPKLSEHAPRNRLAMAKWFFAPGQPLTARVAVNRYWEQLFGIGIVETLEDFGSVGQPPSHPELLDWLALHFQNDLHWDMKALLRELVTSATYRQSAAATSALLEKDPRNRLVARGPRQRLTAEMIRDQALLASGLLSPAIGGPPVMPPQPAGVSQWKDATGLDRYRRAIYTHLNRNAVYPSFVIFDASDHEVSLARRISTNTPLQALVTLNDPVYHEAAQALARRMLTLKGSTADEVLAARLNDGATRVLSRTLSPEERTALATLYADSRKVINGHQSGNSRPPANKDLTALTAVAGVLLNLDAAITR